ncbi:hypothetical protein GCM10009097_51440 [Pigmentiphaga daeguensis]|uniref:Uncharacterized protein n=1 Tax=Pigmentiphaga daeguensis TaxID=414049 RepID=A0ABN1CW27_9BURK
MPDQQTVERPYNRDLPHIRRNPALLWKRLTRPREQWQRRIHPGYPASVLNKVARHRRTAAAADIQHIRPRAGKQRQKPVQPSAFDEFMVSIFLERCGMFPVQGNDIVSGGFGQHGTPAA